MPILLAGCRFLPIRNKTKAKVIIKIQEKFSIITLNEENKIVNQQLPGPPV